MSLRRRRKPEPIDEDIPLIEEGEGSIEKIYFKIKAPIVWEDLPDFIIQDTKDENFGDITNLLKVYNKDFSFIEI